MFHFLFLNLFFFLLLTTWFNFRIIKNILYPPFLFSLFWTINLFLYYCVYVSQVYSIDRLSVNTLLYVFVSVIVFTISGIVASIFCEFSFIKNSPVSIIKKRSIFLITLISLIILPFAIRQGYQSAVENLIMDNLYSSLRNSYSKEEGKEFTILSFSLIFSILAFFNMKYNDYNFKKYNLFISFIIYAMLLSYLILSTGRTYFLLILSMVISLNFDNKKINSSILKFGSIFGIFFILIGFYLGKTAGISTDNNQSSILKGIFESFSSYIIGGIVAFDKFLNSDFVYSYGAQTFRSYVLFLNKIGITDIKVSSLVQEYVNIPFEFNVYTIFYHYVKDFGIYFSLIIISFFSVITVISFYWVKCFKTRISYLFFSFVLYSISMSIFQENFFTLSPFFIYMLFFQFLFFNRFLS
jgi:oligosaccharide repeat unit polymerase